MTTFLDESLAILDRTAPTLNALLRGLPDVWIRVNEGPGTWSPYNVLGHLIHCELEDWIPRVQIILKHGPARPFDPFDRTAHERQDQSIPFQTLLNRFSELRAGSLRQLRELDLQPEQLALTGAHPAFGLVTLRQLIATWAVHDLGHLVQISRVLAKRYRHEVGPWSEYLSVMKS